MKKTVFITGADRGLGFTLCAGLLKRGWRVFAGQYLPQWPELDTLHEKHPENLTIVPLDVSSEKSATEAARVVAKHTEHLDLLINNAGINSPIIKRSIREEQDFELISRLYDINSLGPLRVVIAFLPLLDRGDSKRLCFVSSEAGSINEAKRTGWFGYCMSKAALNMAAKILFNDLHPQGYTFRVYQPGWMKSYLGGEKIDHARLDLDEAAELAIANFLSQRHDESRLVMQDYQGKEWAW